MARIRFNLELYKTHPDWKVETEEGTPARILCTDSPINKDRPVIAIVFDDQIEQYRANGRYDNDDEGCNYDLFLVKPEPKPELTKFEEEVKAWMGVAEDIHIDDSWVRNCAKVLLNLARKEIMKEYGFGENGYDPVCILETIKEKWPIVWDAFVYGEQKPAEWSAEDENDRALTINLLKKGLAEGWGYTEAYNAAIAWLKSLRPQKQGLTDEDMKAMLQLEYERGRADVLKDLPRWEKHPDAATERLAMVWNDAITPWLDWKGYRIAVRDLEKLPGFNAE